METSADWAENTDSGGDIYGARGNDGSDSELLIIGRLMALYLKEAITLVDDRNTDCGMDAVKGDRVC